MNVRRRTYVLLGLAVIASAAATAALGPRGTVPESCGISAPTFAVELCAPAEVDHLMRSAGSDAARALRRQTIADFALIASYVGLWGATGMAIHPAIAAISIAAGAADVVENIGILAGPARMLRATSPPGISSAAPAAAPPPVVPRYVRWAALAKWGLLGLAFVAFVALFRPDRLAARPAALVRALTGLAYGTAGIVCLAGVFDHRALEWIVPPLGIAVIFQLLLCAVAFNEFDRARLRWTAPAPHDPEAGPLSIEQVLREEFQCLHGPLPEGPGGVAGVYEAIHGLREPRTALCISGGGIRSATFGLGVMQGLARAGLLPRFHYLSTVSGGGYIGGWLTAWLHREGNDVPKVARELGALDPSRKLGPEPPEVSHLRDYSNYLAPRPGVMSADSWTLGATVLRNLILIWVVLVPLLAAALAVPRLYVSLVRTRPDQDIETALRWLLMLLGAACLAWAVAYIGASVPRVTTARRGQGRFLVLCLLPLMVAVVSLTLYWAWWPQRHGPWDFMVFGAVVHVAAWLAYTAWLLSPWGAARPAEGSRGHRIALVILEAAIVVVVGAAGGLIAWLVATSIFPEPRDVSLLYASLAPLVFLGAFLLAATLLVGLLSRWTEDEDREWWARCGGWFLVTGLAWLTVSALVSFGPLLLSGPVTAWAVSALGGVSGIVGLAGGWSAKSAAGTGTGASARPSRLRRLILPTAAVVCVAVITIAVAMLTSGVLGKIDPPPAPAAADEKQWPALPSGPFRHVDVLLHTSWLIVAGVAAGLAVLGTLAAAPVNTNQFSLHAMYRSRLIRAYLGASNSGRRGNPFTGFDETDNIQMHELWPNHRTPPGEGAAPTERRALLHVVNLALNLVHGDRLAWQERKAHSFTVSPLHAGSVAASADGAGYRRTRAGTGRTATHYGGKDGISLGTAVTISGAAASPNMGYHSSPLVTFLMTIFNVRLGWWLGNPSARGQRTFYLAGPRLSLRPIVAEAFGLTGRGSPYVYLSDGGHFDNLGLYEMVLRRCRVIVVSDASCDVTCAFNDLGNAVRKIRADLGVPIEFPPDIAIHPRTDAEGRARRVYWAVGRIRYSAVDPPASTAPDPEAARDTRDGWLVYIKAAFYGDEPRDIYEYAMTNAEFPHESTVDQFFSESQFESYRMLGSHVIRRLCEGWSGATPMDLARHAATSRGV